MNSITFLCLFAAFCSTFAWVPQVIKITKTKETSGISLSMYFMLAVGITSWLIYGLLIKDVPIIAANGISLIFTMIVIVLKFKYK